MPLPVAFPPPVQLRLPGRPTLAVRRYGSLDDTDGGTGRPVLLVHGMASNALLWHGVAHRLAARGQPVVAVDLRGHGRSAKPDDGYDPPTVAADLAALLAVLDWPEPPVVAGQSWGGNVVLELAARGAAVHALALVDGGWLHLRRQFADWPACRDALAPPKLAGRPYAEIAAHLRAAHPDWPPEGVEGALACFERRPDGTVAPWLTFERHLACLRGLWDHPPAYDGVDAPVLLLAAETPDQPDWLRVKRAEVAAAASALPVTQTVWLTGDHDLHAQQPDRVAALLADLA